MLPISKKRIFNRHGIDSSMMKPLLYRGLKNPHRGLKMTDGVGLRAGAFDRDKKCTKYFMWEPANWGDEC